VAGVEERINAYKVMVRKFERRRPLLVHPGVEERIL
jgi:hypothetical protein